MLESAGYESVEQPRSIGGIPFDFAAMLAGRASLDLIVLVDLAVESDDGLIRRRIAALARALDLVGSRRSLTVVLVGPSRGPGLVQGLTGSARVLAVGTAADGDDEDLSDALAVLLPLKVTPEMDNPADSWPLIRERMASKHGDEVGPVLSATRSGSAAVEDALREFLVAALRDTDASGGSGGD